MDKFPWMQFNTGDWLKDPNLSMCQPATRGIWIDAIAAMHENRRSGTLSGTPDQLIRVLRCTGPALMAALDDLQSTGAGVVTVRNGVVTLTNRRMSREASIRDSNRLRQLKHRGHGDNNGAVTPKSPSDSISSSLSDFVREKKESEEKEGLALFERFWAAYPRHEARQNGLKAFQKLNPDEELVSVMIPWIGRARESEQWQNKDKIPHASTWLNQRRWEDDPPPKATQQAGGSRAISSNSRSADRTPFAGAPAFVPGK